MRKLILALVLTTAVCLALAAAAAADPGPIQVSGQSATTAQQADAASSATQVDPSNTNISIRVLSPGDDGDVSQSNTAGSSASAGNQAGTTQSADQGADGSAVQTAEQEAGTGQAAQALSQAAQLDPSNTNVSIRVFSPGDDGSVTQSNSAGSSAQSGNAATTTQTAGQDQGGSCGCQPDPGIQTANQSAGTEQNAGAASTATQDQPSNTNVSIRVLSPGDDGSVSQSNTVGSSATAGNTASTTQSAQQSQSGSGCGCSADPVQQAKQDAGTGQQAGGLSGAAQDGASNGSDPAGVESAGDGGTTTQGNTAGSSATAGNAGTTNQQSAQQNGSANAIQTGDQSADTDQSATALSGATQIDPSNTAGSVRVLSPGDGGDVTEDNTVGSSATAGNQATTQQQSTQSADGSSCGCEPVAAAAPQTAAAGPAIQIAGQQASTEQGALAGSLAVQRGASNEASPVRVLSPGSDGDVTQSNVVGSSATAGNTASTTQATGQTAGSGSCGCGTDPIQVSGQKADTGQGAVALSGAEQAFGDGGDRGCGCGSASGNVDDPVLVWSPGSGGDVTQSNTAGSSATAGNAASTGQSAAQSASGPAIQALGQEAGTEQLAFAASLVAQIDPSNDVAPVRVYSPGGGGSVTQGNSAGSSASSGNEASTGQDASQVAGGSSCPCAIPPIQVAGQKAWTDQLAKAFSGAFQVDPANCFGPVRVWSAGEDGSMSQGNAAASRADSGSSAGTEGEAMQAS